MDQPRPPSFNMGLGMMGAMPMAPPMSMMLPATMPSGKVSGETAVMQRMPQNMMYCYNPLMIPSPMRMMMPMVAPPYDDAHGASCSTNAASSRSTCTARR
ncbi:hypothetical protein EB796_000883 [Bugula neritina]|uniref:Uncharacterized protein n=1 Tax=Bugula neritina TaxID=10212 RepID=A0A7J7KRN1_BUGNE|nr:hypothetical protein EB796_000883 [Bugula neritina]